MHLTLRRLYSCSRRITVIRHAPDIELSYSCPRRITNPLLAADHQSLAHDESQIPCSRRITSPLPTTDHKSLARGGSQSATAPPGADCGPLRAGEKPHLYHAHGGSQSTAPSGANCGPLRAQKLVPAHGGSQSLAHGGSPIPCSRRITIRRSPWTVSPP
jgi:hypothetical protein